MSWLLALLSHLYRLCQHFYPPSYREEFGTEQAEVFDQVLQAAVRESGRRLLTQAFLELVELPAAALRLRFHRRDKAMIRQIFPKTSDRTPWAAALLSLAPLFLLGPVMIALGYLPAWRSVAVSPAASRFTSIFLMLPIVAGLVIGVLKKFPRWSYPYWVFGMLMLLIIATELTRGLPWEIHRDGYTLLILTGSIILLTWLLPSLRPFQANLRQDWTLLSYGLCSLTLLIVSLHDSDVVPSISLLVILPSLVCLAGMLAYLRLASSVQRFVALLASTFLAVLLWTLPFFDSASMLGIPVGLHFDRFLLAAWAIPPALIVSPMLIGVHNRLKERGKPGTSAPTMSSK